jgi:LuxR family transcriptional regulator, maltose regulon positive regulatory protein
MGASLVLAERYDQAQPWLTQAAASFRACADPYGEAIVRLWQCLLWHHTEDAARLARDVAELLRLSNNNGFDFLFYRRTLGGPPDPRSLAPLLLFARDNDCEAAYAARLLAHLDLSRVKIHPGYRLRVQTLGPFRLWRGAQEVPDGDWTRKKARQVFHLLLTYRHTMLEREQIAEMLWPELDPETAERDFKIAYSALNNVLEPLRRRNAPVAFVRRDGSRYGLRQEADLWLDAGEFEQFIEEGDRCFQDDGATALDYFQRALDLYQGEYLQEFPYAEWASEERERLLTLYLRTAERLASALLEERSWAATIDVCQAILARDDCWEQAYRIMMQAYAQQGNRAQALRVYHRCRERLQTELGVEPTPATVQVYEAIK